MSVRKGSVSLLLKHSRGCQCYWTMSHNSNTKVLSSVNHQVFLFVPIYQELIECWVGCSVSYHSNQASQEWGSRSCIFKSSLGESSGTYTCETVTENLSSFLVCMLMCTWLGSMHVFTCISMCTYLYMNLCA